MMQGYFGEKGELFFEIELIAADGSVVTVNALLDTGFTDWLAMDTQDAERKFGVNIYSSAGNANCTGRCSV